MISVALCTYNGAAYLTEQLRSIAGQSRRPDELVVCDDASSDASAAIVRAFAAEAPFPVRLEINPRNLGVAENFARAIALCQGDWIALCDQDDVWRADKLERQWAAVEAQPQAQLIFSDAELIDAAGRPMGQRLWDAVRFTPAERRRFQSGAQTAVLVRHNVVTGATVLYRAALRRLILPIAPGWLHDGWLALLAAAVAPCVALPEPLLAYRQHPDQQIGERRRSLYEQYQRGKSRTAADFQTVAANYAAAAERLAHWPSPLRDPCLPDLLREKAAHYRAKAAMRAPRQFRTPWVLRELLAGHYARYSSGWRSLAQDLFL